MANSFGGDIMNTQMPIGTVDAIWMDGSRQLSQLWQVTGASAVATSPLKTAAAPGWRVIGSADIGTANQGNVDLKTRDGNYDLLWQNDQTGQIVWWILKDKEIVGAHWVEGPGDLNWAITAVGDFDHDGNADLVWRNRVTGENALWYQTVDQTLRAGEWLLKVPDLGWSIVAAQDYDRNGKADLLWRNTGTGEVVWWLLDNGQITGTASLGLSDATINLAGALDFNADGQVDLLWHDRRNGNVALWLTDGTDIVARYALTTVPIGWDFSGFLPTSGTPETDAGNTLALATGVGQAQFFRAQTVGETDSQDFYRFQVKESGYFSATVTGIQGDVDVRLIQDQNNNGSIDAGEVKASAWERGSLRESARSYLTPGVYFVETSSYRGAAARYSLSTQFTPAAIDRDRFNLRVEFGAGSAGLSAAAKATILEAARFWESVIPSRSVITEFGDLSVQLEVKDIADSNVLAYAGPTFTSNGTQVSIKTGTAVINRSRLGELNGNLPYLRQLMIHELTHVLGFGTLWEPVRFRFGDGSIQALGRNLIDRTLTTYNANTYAGAAYGDLIGATGAVAIPIEPQVFTHWDEGRFDRELLTPYIESPGVTMPVSTMTLASLRDLGWTVNMGAAQAYALS